MPSSSSSSYLFGVFIVVLVLVGGFFPDYYCWLLMVNLKCSSVVLAFAFVHAQLLAVICLWFISQNHIFHNLISSTPVYVSVRMCLVSCRVSTHGTLRWRRVGERRERKAPCALYIHKHICWRQKKRKSKLNWHDDGGASWQNIRIRDRQHEEGAEDLFE